MYFDCLNYFSILQVTATDKLGERMSYLLGKKIWNQASVAISDFSNTMVTMSELTAAFKG
jgi:hypothetical protein